MGRHSSFDQWHRERLELPDGDVLTWVRIDTPPPVHVDAFRLTSRGAIHRVEALALLTAAGHPDADLDARLEPSFGDTLGLRLGFISGLRSSSARPMA